jgi:hypothetical protein
MKRVAAALALVWILVLPASAQQPPPPQCAEVKVGPSTFQVCQGLFALCTTAPCKTSTTNPDKLECDCTVNPGYSAGSQVYNPPSRVVPGSTLSSRYFPITNYQVCTATPDDKNPWAWCLDATCTVSSNPAFATCSCSRVTGSTYRGQPTTPWIVVTTQYNASNCTTPIWSSATIDEMQAATAAMNQYIRKYDVPNMFVPVKINP